MNSSERVLILAPTGRDGAVAESLLRASSFNPLACADFEGLVVAIGEGAGAVVLTEEALLNTRSRVFSDWVAAQPSWSDFPVILLTHRSNRADEEMVRADLTNQLGNVRFLDRPFHPSALIRAVENALRARRRQYSARSTLDRLAENEQRLALALTTGRLGPFSLGIGDEALVASDLCKANFGRGPDHAFDYGQMLGAVHASDRDRVRKAITDSIEARIDGEVEFRVTWPDGSERWLDMRVGVLPDRFGRALTLAGVTSDITARKTSQEALESLIHELAIEREHTQEALRGERAFSGLLMRSVPAGIVGYDANLQITAWNPMMERLVGLGAPSVLDRKLSDVIAPDQMTQMEPRIRQALAGESGPINELEFTTETGQVWLEVQHAPLSGGDGQLAGGVAFFRDVTERRHAEEQLRQSQKMEMIGQLTGGVAHDFNNLLAAVLGNLELLAKKLPANDELRRHIEGAQRGAERGAALTQRLLAFARRQDLRPVPVDLRNLLEGMRGLLERSLSALVSVRMEMGSNVPPAVVDANQLELAVLNLAVNARDAMPSGGTLTIRLEEAIPPAELNLSGRFLRLSVEDTGSGMDRDTLKRAIEPFFSTKEIGKGTGLGLSMVHGLAQQLGGALSLSSRVGQGTVAELWLPAADGAVAPVEDVPKMIEPAGPATILVVDDDALIAMNTVDMVQDLGHTVLEAYSGKQALEILASDARVDALITDYAMPGMTGAELATRARELRPNLPILLATGYADLPSGVTIDLPRLGKPYQQRDLSEQLSMLLRPTSV